MPAYDTLAKGVNKAQLEAFELACFSAGLTRKEAIDAAIKQFVEAQGVEWPETGKHGGDRKSARAKKQD